MEVRPSELVCVLKAHPDPAGRAPVRGKPLSAQRLAHRAVPLALWPPCHPAVRAASAWAPRAMENRGTTAVLHLTVKKSGRGASMGLSDGKHCHQKPTALLHSGPQRHATWFVLFSSDLPYSGAFT